MNSERRVEKISKKGNNVQLYQVTNLPKRIPKEWKIKNTGIKKEINPKISIKSDDKYEPKAPKIFELSLILESYLKKLLSTWLYVIKETKVIEPIEKSMKEIKNFSKLALKFLNIN